jgi:hypothetical protein
MKTCSDASVVAQDIEILSAAGTVDWLTITVKGYEKRHLVMQEVQRIASDLEGQGNVRRKWGMKGYLGYNIAGLRWGIRDDSDICMLSGETAALNWEPALALAENVTRVDLAATLTLAKPKMDVARSAYSLIITDPDKCHCKKRRFTFIENTAGGQTLYVGSRASDQFGRLYDKGCESEENLCAPPGIIWRYEVEFKSYRAKKLAIQLAETARREETDVSEDIGTFVSQWFIGRNITPIWVGASDDMDWTCEIEAQITDDDASLRWLSIQVRPTVERLLDRKRADEVFDALGITIISQAELDQRRIDARSLDKV